MCVPNGVVYPRALLNTSHWKHWTGNGTAATSNASKPMLWAMAASYYSSLQWVVESIDRETHASQGLEDMSLGLGGFQIAQATPMGGAFYVEGVLEELDWAGEFFYENATGELYYYMNRTTEAEAEFLSPALKTLVHVQGSSADPVRDVSFVNLTFAYSAATFLEPYTAVLGGGDYASHVGSAALFAVGVDGLTVENCRFRDVGGNAVLLYSFVRHARIVDSEFVRTGAHAIISVGTSQMVDGSGPDHPDGNVIVGNLAREIGVLEKETCFYMQAMSTSTVLRENIAYNAPRALINFNVSDALPSPHVCRTDPAPVCLLLSAAVCCCQDEFGGGHLVERNLLFNAVRETADHGPFNSYNRLPQMTTTRDPERKRASYFPAWSNLTRNFIVANYHSDDGMDHDDGSRYCKEAILSRFDWRTVVLNNGTLIQTTTRTISWFTAARAANGAPTSSASETISSTRSISLLSMAWIATC